MKCRNAHDEWLSFFLEIPVKWALVGWTLWTSWPDPTTAGGHHGSNLMRLLGVL